MHLFVMAFFNICAEMLVRKTATSAHTSASSMSRWPRCWRRDADGGPQELDVSGNALLFTAAGSPLEGAAVLQSVRALGDSCGELRRLRLATGTLPPAMVADRRPLWAEGAGLAFAVEA